MAVEGSLWRWGLKRLGKTVAHPAPNSSQSAQWHPPLLHVVLVQVRVVHDGWAGPFVGKALGRAVVTWRAGGQGGVKEVAGAGTPPGSPLPLTCFHCGACMHTSRSHLLLPAPLTAGKVAGEDVGVLQRGRATPHQLHCLDTLAVLHVLGRQSRTGKEGWARSQMLHNRPAGNSEPMLESGSAFKLQLGGPPGNQHGQRTGRRSRHERTAGPPASKGDSGTAW